MRIIHVLVGLLALTAAWATGCKGPEAVRIVPGEDWHEEGTDQEELDTDTAIDQAWNQTALDTHVPTGREIVFIRREDAKKAPSLIASTVDGVEMNLSAALPGQVTLVLFWAMDLPLPQERLADVSMFINGSEEAGDRLEAYMRRTSRNMPSTAMARHVRDLIRKHGHLEVRAIGIVEKTYGRDRRGRKRPADNYRLAPLYASARQLRYAMHYDNFTALETMAKAAGSGSKGDLPALFILDRRGRVRVAKLGFAYAVHRSTVISGELERVVDNAPPGQRIEDYLIRLLEED
jgi:hypothetical protein